LHRSKELGEQHGVQVPPDKSRALKENHRAAEVPPEEIPKSDEDLSIKSPVSCERNHNG
jgi:hypothetical protein